MRIANSDMRLTFESAKKLCQDEGLDVKKANPANGFLRFETEIINNQSTYKFPVLQNETYNGQNQSPTEQRLALQDNFVVGSMGYFLQFWKRATNKPATNLLTYIGPFNASSGIGQGTPCWNDTLNFSTTAGYVRNIAEEFWQSCFLTLNVNYRQIIPRYDLLRHYYVPIMQQQFNTITGGNDAPYPYAWTMDSIAGESDGFYPQEPNFVISGGKNTELSITNPVASSFTDLNWNFESGVFFPKMVLIMRGILLQNTTSVKG